MSAEDPIVREVREARESHTVRFGYDLAAIYRDLKRQEEDSERRFVSYPPRRLVRTANATPLRRERAA